jgi:hypothetical protein
MEASMTTRSLLFLLLISAGPTCAAPWVTGAELVNETTLVIKTRTGDELAPMLKEQVEFDEPKVSGDGRHVGWLALVPGCCTSYPVPATLVVLGPDRSMRRFSGDQYTWGWCFTPDARAVVYRRAASHGITRHLFEMRRLSDGRLLRRHLASPDALDDIRRLPRWMRCAAQ